MNHRRGRRLGAASPAVDRCHTANASTATAALLSTSAVSSKCVEGARDAVGDSHIGSGRIATRAWSSRESANNGVSAGLRRVA